MNTVFEDEFMDVQAGLISLCLEVTEEKVNKVYAYCCNEKKRKMFNAFFVINEEVKGLHELGIVNQLAFQFLKLGTKDLTKVDAICQKHNMPTPTEMKLCYDVTTGKFNADYKYEEVCSARTEKNPVDVFLEWIQEIKGRIGDGSLS